MFRKCIQRGCGRSHFKFYTEMKLQYDFPLKVRNLFIGCWECWQCGGNGQDRGGLAIHHIWGRVSSSALNAAVLCGECHDHVSHSTETRCRYFTQTFRYLETMAEVGLFVF